MSEEVERTLTHQGRTTNVRFFIDDTIETIRAKIGLAINEHPDRLRIYVRAELPGSYYEDDPRRWKSLFLRLSPDGTPIRDIAKKAYNASRDIQLPFPDGDIDEATWMTEVPRSLEASFQELRILGVPESKSWVFPLDNTTDPGVLPAPSDIARPELKQIFKGFYEKDVGFVVIPFEEGGRPLLKDQYVPYLRSSTPAKIPDSVRASIVSQTNILKALEKLPAPKPTTTAVVRARWRIPWITTDFGESPRNRFEQIFFAMTVTPKTPYVGFFVSRQEEAQHKFYTEDVNEKAPLFDMKVWTHWWAYTKTSRRNRPTLMMYRGERNNFDHIQVTTKDIVIVSWRTDDNKDSLDEMQTDIREWMKTFDSLLPFVDETDLERWELMTASAQFTYSSALEEADFRRFDCLRTIYDVSDKKTLEFRFLRTNGADIGLTPAESTVLQLVRDEPGTSVEDIQESFQIQPDEAERLLGTVRSKMEEDPTLAERITQSFPVFRFSSKTALVTSTDDIERLGRYISILRYVFLNPDDKSLEAVCPKRAEQVEAASAIVPVAAAEEEAGDLGGLEDLLNDIGNDTGLSLADLAPAPAPVVSVAPKKAKAKVKTATEDESLYNYFNQRLQEFDPTTFTQANKKCDLARQPIVMSSADIAASGAFNPLESIHYGEQKVLETTEPDGIFLCPEYWCVTDKIPLTESELVAGACPVCGGKIRDSKSKAKISEYSVLKRNDKYKFPGEQAKSPEGKSLPCCFQKPQTTRVSKMMNLPPSGLELSYVLGETKIPLPEKRLGYLHPRTAQSLGIPIRYDSIKRDTNRIQAGEGAYLRIGVGHPTETLPAMIGASHVKSPAENPEVVLRCSFFRTWPRTADRAPEALVTKYGEAIARIIVSIHEAYMEKRLSVLDELEFVSISLDCDLFRVLVDPDGTTQVGCMFASGFLRSVNRAVAVIFHTEDMNAIEYIGYVTKTASPSQPPKLIVNLFSFPPSAELEIYKILTYHRERVCIATALPTMRTLMQFTNPNTVIILDPYRRSQAFFFPKKFILPFQPESIADTSAYRKLFGYADIQPDDLPTQDNQIAVLKRVAEYHRGYEYVETLQDSSGMGREIVVRSGLRIPIQPVAVEKKLPAREVVETVRKNKESSLVFSTANKEDTATSNLIRYESEVFEFLIFQLSKDVEDDEDLLHAIQTKEGLKETLHSWFTSRVVFHQLADPPTFVSKVRTPCSTGRCDGTMCARVGSKCKVDVKKLDGSKLERRLLSTLMSNEKVRAIVLEPGRATPFFSTVLYMELPHELFLSDSDLKTFVRSE